MKKIAALLSVLLSASLLLASCGRTGEPPLKTEEPAETAAETAATAAPEVILDRPEVLYPADWLDVYFDYELTRGGETKSERIWYYGGEYAVKYDCECVLMLMDAAERIERYYYLATGGGIETYWSKEDLTDLQFYAEGEAPSEEEARAVADYIRGITGLVTMEDPFFSEVRYRRIDVPSREEGYLDYELIGADGETAGTVTIDAEKGYLVHLEREGEVLKLLSFSDWLPEYAAETGNG